MPSPRNRILIVTSGSLSRNPRPAKEAATLARQGYDVTVLRPSEGGHYDRLDASQFGHDGHRDMILPTPTGGVARRCDRAALWAARKAVRLGWESVRVLGPGKELFSAAQRIRPDLTIVHNEIGLWVGERLIECGWKVAADIEDWYSEDLPAGQRHHRPLRLLRRLEGRMLRSAAYVSTTSRALAQALQQRYGGSTPRVITNSFPLQPLPSRTGPDTPVSLLWFSQTVGPGRGLEEFLEVWIRLRTPTRLVLLGQLQDGYAGVLLSLVPVEQRSRLEFAPLVPPSELPTVIARHDVGLALEQSGIASRNLTITNKLLQYLNAGLAVVATPTSGQREVLAEAPAAGVLVDLSNPGADAATIDRLIGNAAHLAVAQRAARTAAVERYSWEVEAPRLLEAVATALA